MRIVVLIAIVAAVGLASGAQRPADSPPGTRLEQHSWVTAEQALTPETVVVIPLGAALKEHGPHLKLRNDLALAEYFTERVVARSSVVVTAPLTYHFYPAFLDYPGSTSLSLETARDYTVQIVRNLAQHGPRRFYVLNTGISTDRALEPAAALLAQEGILLGYTNLGEALDRAAAGVRQQEGGSHADEVETSMMLYIDPSSVDMSLAVKDFSPRSTPMRLRRHKDVPGTYSPTGIWGDPTLATREKGRVIVESLVKTMLDDIETVRTMAVPAAGQSGPAAAPAQPPTRAPQEVRLPNGCTPGDERSIRRIEMTFNLAWRQIDAEAVAALWAEEGDIVHADGFTERGRRTIQQNRAEQFRRREFRGSRHVLAFGSVRCINPRVAVVDSRWELSGVLDVSGNTLPNADGLSTLVVTAALKDAIVVMDSHGNLEWRNPAAQQLLGLREQDAGQPVTNLVRHPAFKEYFDRGRYQDPLELPSPINERLTLQVTLTRFGNNEHLMVVRDVTRLHRLEQMRKDFVANVSHELRTPLTVIAGYLETLLAHQDDINPRWLKPLRSMESQSERMKHLLEDLLLLAKLEATTYPAHNQPVNVSLMLTVIQRDAQSLSGSREHSIRLEADAELRLKGDEMELRSAFSNLVFNAVKYTQAGGEIDIRWWRDELGAHLSVADNGPGIENKHLPRLTERFYRVDSSRASNTGGTGLGLAIVKHVLLRHQGRLDIQSRLGHGSCFSCHFPPSQIADARSEALAEAGDDEQA